MYLLYASGEILLVVIGIVFALQIDNWNENRNIRSAEQLLLENLKLEMAANQEQLNVAMLYHSKSRTGAKRILEIYTGVHPIENYAEVDSLLALIQWAWISNFEDRINDAKEESKIIQNLIIDKFIPAVNRYISLNQRIKYLGEEYAIGTSSFKPDYEGLFNDRILEGIISYIYIWRIEELKEEEQLNEMMGSFISTLDKEIYN